MDNTKLVISIAIMAAVTFLTRAMPFILFDRGNSPAPIILYVGKYLPPALISAIIVYCYKDVQFSQGTHGCLELLAALAVIALQLRFKNTMISIFAGTIFYMLLLRLI